MKRYVLNVLLVVVSCVMYSTTAFANLPQLPVQEITVFKDGHAFVVHEGTMTTNGQGNVQLDDLPKPILGTFWPYSCDPDVQLKAVVAGQEEQLTHRPTRSLADLIAANHGARTWVQEINEKEPYQATIVESEKREERKSEENLSKEPGNLVMLQTEQGTKVLAVDQIRTLTFEKKPDQSFKYTTQNKLLTLCLKSSSPNKTTQAKVGLAYVQKGVRWIPSYRVDIDGQGQAKIKLQATLINELTDLSDVKMNLVVGVPEFAFKDDLDPISLQATVSMVSPYLNANARTQYALSNAIMSQTPVYSNQARSAASGSELNLGPDVEKTQGQEDLFVFTLDHLSLKKGERMVMPLAEYEISYKDVYVLNLPFSPPLEMRQRFSSSQQLELSRLLHASKVMHVLRIDNNAAYPFTTAPAMIMKDNQILAQGMITYTPIHGTCDLKVTKAIDVSVKHEDQQDNQKYEPVSLNGNRFRKISMNGQVTLVNHKNRAIDIEIKRSVLGQVDEADQEGIKHQAGHGLNWEFSQEEPLWWQWYNWPWWWYHFNSTGYIQWHVTLKPNESVDLTYAWHYYWQI